MSAEFEKNVYGKFENIDKRFENIDKRFENIDKKFDNIDKRFESIDKKFDNIDKKFESIDKKFDNIDKKFEQLDKFQQDVHEKFDEITHILDVIRQSQVLLEEQIMLKIPALFDGYSMHQEKQEILEKEIDSINHNVEDHDIRISILEQQSV